LKIYVNYENEDSHLKDVINLLFDLGEISARIIEKRFKVGHGRSKRIMKSLREKQIITPKSNKRSTPLCFKKNIIEIEQPKARVKTEEDPFESFSNETEANGSDTNQYGKVVNSGLPAINPETGKFMGIEEFMEYYGIPFDHMKSYKLVAHQQGYQTYNIASRSFSSIEEDSWREEFIENVKKHSPTYREFKREKQRDPHMLLFDPADIHVGKYASKMETGTEYNVDIAVNRVRDGLHGVLQKASGFTIEKVFVVIGNDVLHTDTPKTTTTSGTHQDTIGLWHENFVAAYKMYVNMIEELLTVADVHVIFNPSNHDWQQGFCLAQTVQAHFNKTNHVSFQVDMNHRKYTTYGKNLIGTTHGDSCKIPKLPLVMATESKDWTSCTKRYWYTHHVHSKHTEDFTGVTVESIRSPSEADGWHSRTGWVGAPKAIEGFIHHPTQGQIARLSHYF